MKIISKTVAELTPTEYRACYRANYGDSGYMQGMLWERRKYPSRHDGRVIMLWDGPDDKVSSLLGWSLLTPVSLYGIAAATRYTKRRSIYTAQFWVKQKHRRKGYAKVLMNEAKKLDPRPHVIPHSTASAELFSSYDVTVLKSERSWIRKKPKVA